MAARHSASRVAHYRKVLAELFADVWATGQPISWLDIGAGYGEVVEAIGKLAPPGSSIDGIEPLETKVLRAQTRGLAVIRGDLHSVTRRYQYVSLVNVFSHLPDFRQFLEQLKHIMSPPSELLMETGNAGDLSSRDELPEELRLPDHLVFAGERHIRRFLTEAGFTVLRIKSVRTDGVLNFAKNVIKRAIGIPVVPILPYQSKSRSILFRARIAP